MWGHQIEPEGFADFVLARSGALHRTAYLLTRDHAAAEDLVQSALLKAWRRWAQAQQPEAYVRRILVNEYLTQSRRLWRGELPTERLPECVAPDAAERVVAEDSVAQALADLSPQQRAVVVLRFFHDLTERQTADHLGVSIGTVKAHQSRALDRLRVSEHLVPERHAPGPLVVADERNEP
ncbi:SigE family RNA polymerase sigma factor [Terrabacter sp. BE26]|uniref:SigE family RNA polymerase sigma factor n=1 Tax=Terrabacter sp. BE26 TaxID=2898152 RepID=UPI0035BE7DD4